MQNEERHGLMEISMWEWYGSEMVSLIPNSTDGQEAIQEYLQLPTLKPQAAGG